MRKLLIGLAALCGFASLVITPAPVAVIPPETNTELAEIRANFGETSHVANEVMNGVQGAGSAEIFIGLDGTVSAKLLTGRRTAAVDYPSVGPYWEELRWRDVDNYQVGSDTRAKWGHPFVIFYDTDDLHTIHPMVTSARKWSSNDFITVWTDDAVAGQFRDWQVNNYWKAQMSSGARVDTCNHTFMSWDSEMRVNRMIGYWDHEAFSWGCFVTPEINVFRTASQMGIMQGLLWHREDGSPSLMSQSPAGPVYIWPQTYDWRTKDWYNGPSSLGAALLMCFAGWFFLRQHRRRNQYSE